MSSSGLSKLVEPNNGAPLLPYQVILAFVGFVGVIFLMALAKKIWYRFVFKKRYYIIPRTQIKGIANIAMVISMTIAIIFSLTIISANGFGVLFRAYVGTRMSIESILIKIGGVLFGPFIGIFIGAFTDILTVLLTSGIFHYGYFICAMGYGFMAGLIKTMMIYSRDKNYTFTVLNSIILVILTIFTLIVFHYLPARFSVNSVIKINGLTKEFMLYIILSVYILVAILIWSLLPLSKKTFFKKNNPKYIQVEGFGQVDINKKGHNNTKRNWYKILVSVIMINLLSQVSIDLFVIPVFDVTISSISYSQWFAMRFILLLPLIVFNSIVLYLVYWIIFPIISYQYVEDMVEEIKLPMSFA